MKTKGMSKYLFCVLVFFCLFNICNSVYALGESSSIFGTDYTDLCDDNCTIGYDFAGGSGGGNHNSNLLLAEYSKTILRYANLSEKTKLYEHLVNGLQTEAYWYCFGSNFPGIYELRFLHTLCFLKTFADCNSDLYNELTGAIEHSRKIMFNECTILYIFYCYDCHESFSTLIQRLTDQS